MHIAAWGGFGYRQAIEKERKRGRPHEFQRGSMPEGDGRFGKKKRAKDCACSVHHVGLGCENRSISLIGGSGPLLMIADHYLNVAVACNSVKPRKKPLFNPFALIKCEDDQSFASRPRG